MFAFYVALFFGLLIHIWTVTIAVRLYGIVGGIISLILPILAELYTAVILWVGSGTFMNRYCLVVVGYLIGCFLGKKLMEEEAANAPPASTQPQQ